MLASRVPIEGNPAVDNVTSQPTFDHAVQILGRLAAPGVISPNSAPAATIIRATRMIPPAWRVLRKTVPIPLPFLRSDAAGSKRLRRP